MYCAWYNAVIKHNSAGTQAVGGAALNASVSLFVKWVCWWHSPHRAVVRTESIAVIGTRSALSTRQQLLLHWLALLPYSECPETRGGDLSRRGLSSYSLESFKIGKFRNSVIDRVALQNHCSWPCLISSHLAALDSSEGKAEEEGGRRDRTGRERKGLQFITAILKITGRPTGPPRPRGWANTLFVLCLCWVTRANALSLSL